jgi:lipoyl(octanoyl) transferase
MLSGSRRPNGCDGILLVLEHDPVYTVGLRSHRYPESVETDLRRLGADFHRTNRGGLITFHGPGQLVVYPILHLRHWGLGVKSYVYNLEQAIIEACQKLGVQGERSPKYTGVWIGKSKIAALGIHTGNFVTTHGLAVNCSTDLRWFETIVPCGIQGRAVTSLSNELGKTVDIGEVIPIFLKSLASAFHCTVIEKNSVEEAIGSDN